MNLIVLGVVVKVSGALVVDALNYLVARSGMISRIHIAMIGRMSAGWARGRFRYATPSEMVQVPNEMLIGLVTRDAIGVGLAVPFVLAWAFLAGGLPSAMWTLVYGLATNAASWLFVYPSMGLGVFGRLSPEGMKASISPVANHLFYGIGMPLGVALV